MALIDEARRRNLISSIPTDGPPKAPAADGSQNNPLNTDAGRAITNTLNALPGAGSIPGAAARGASLVGRAFGASQPAVSAAGSAAQAAAPYAPVVAGGAALASAASANGPQPPTPTPSATASTMSPAIPQPRSLMQAAFGDASGSAAPDVASANAEETGNVTRVGNSYTGTNVSGDITINGQAPRNGGQISSQNMAAAENLAASSSGAGMPLVQAAGIRHSGNDWQSRNDLRNAAVSANSIMNTRRWGGPGAENNPAVQEYRAMLGTDQSLRQAQPGMAQAAMRENAGLQREGMQQTGANSRSLMSAMLGQERLSMERETQGYANRAAAQQEQLRNQVEQEQDPTKRRSLVQRMQDVSGKTQADPYLVVQGGQQVDENGRPYNMPSSVFNRQTGQFVQQPGQGGGRAPSDNHVAALRANPTQAHFFDQQYGKGEAARILGGQ